LEIITVGSKNAYLAVGTPGFANFPAVGNEVEMKSVIILGRYEIFQDLVSLLARGLSTN
jgi:hypothetical protein